MIPEGEYQSGVRSHSDQITSLSISEKNPEIMVTGSRDRSAILWEIKKKEKIEIVPMKRLKGHSHFVSDVKVSSDGQFCVTGSWDNTLRLWDLNSGKNISKFIGHTKDILSISLSNDDRHIASGSRDGTVKIWNSLGNCKETFRDESSSSWISNVIFLPTVEPLILTCSWDGIIRLWNINEKVIKTKLFGHNGYILCSTVSPDGSLCASGGKDGIIILWDLQEGKHLYSLKAGGGVIHLNFSPNKYWLSAITSEGLKIWDLEFRSQHEDSTKGSWSPSKNFLRSQPISSTWSRDGALLFTGHSDGSINIWRFKEEEI